MTRRILDEAVDITDIFDSGSINDVMKQLAFYKGLGYSGIAVAINEDCDPVIYVQRWRSETEAEARVREELEEVRDRAYMEG
jgi:pantothenate kinase-related protein Tda10